MQAFIPVGAGLDAFKGRSLQKLGVMYAECNLKGHKTEGRSFVLHSRYLRANYGREYAAMLHYLLGVGALRVVPYANGCTYFDQHSRQFVLVPFGGELRRVEVSKAERAAMRRRRSAQAVELCEAIEGAAALVNVWPLVSIDVGAANSYLDGMQRVIEAGGSHDLRPTKSGSATPRERLMHRRLAVDWFEHGGLSFNEHTGRVFSPLTNLPRELRPFLRVEGVERLGLLDVRNSQPFVMCALYAEATGDGGPLKVAAAGMFYEVVNERRPELSRSEIKVGVLASIYGRRMKPTREAGRGLVEAFPELWDWVCRQRAGAVHLAVRMQRAEASWVLPVACELAKGGAFVATLHDALLIDQRRECEAREALAAAAFERWGVRPSFGFEAISGPE